MRMALGRVVGAPEMRWNRRSLDEVETCWASGATRRLNFRKSRRVMAMAGIRTPSFDIPMIDFGLVTARRQQSV